MAVLRFDFCAHSLARSFTSQIDAGVYNFSFSGTIIEEKETQTIETTAAIICLDFRIENAHVHRCNSYCVYIFS